MSETVILTFFKCVYSAGIDDILPNSKPVLPKLFKVYKSCLVGMYRLQSARPEDA